jgi:ureidoacrylate peracid hydrolase
MDAPSSSLSIEARPMPFSMDPSRAAVLVDDMQNDFASEGGAFAHAGLDTVPVQNIVAPIARILAAARETGMKVIYLKMAFRPDFSDVGAPGSKNWSLHTFLSMGEPVTGPDGQPSRQWTHVLPLIIRELGLPHECQHRKSLRFLEWLVGSHRF